MVDLRSDTITRPTPEMREAMARAEVGDDVFGEDPTVNRLEAMAADLLGKEAGLFVASGTMGNLVALLTHCRRGDEAIVGDKSHTLRYEQGGMAALGGIMPHVVPNLDDGTMALEAIEAAIRPPNVHFPRTRLVALENTHNLCAGVPLTAAYTRRVGELAHARGLKMHIDGARLFNAAAALGLPARELAAPADSVTFCLSKGLCAPVGSVLVGSAAFIAEARRARKVVGGGMRQAGVIAAAGIVALEKMRARLVEDHRRARRLAVGWGALPAVTVEPVHTNMVYFAVDESVPLAAQAIVAALKERGVLLLAVGGRRFRAVTHYWIDDAAVEQAIAALGEVLSAA